MKKVLLLSLGLVMGFSAFAQKTVSKSELRKHTVTKGAAFGTEVVVNTAETFAPKSQQSVVTNRYTNREESEVIHTQYDLQSNSFVANRMYQRNNGAIGVVTTLSMDGTAGAADRVQVTTTTTVANGVKCQKNVSNQKEQAGHH